MGCSQSLLVKCALLAANFLFMVMGLVLMGCAMDILFDIERMLISRAVISSTAMPQPLYYYIALSLIAIGLFISSLSVLGCWATHCKNSCFIGLFMFLLVVMLVMEIVGCILMAVCPQMLGAHIVEEEILDNWQRNYGVPGREQFTAAVDLVQTKGCLTHLQEWLSHELSTGILTTLLVVSLQLLLLLFAILMCVKSVQQSNSTVKPSLSSLMMTSQQHKQNTIKRNFNYNN
ncbi:hypothetical protein LSTR_LSTR003165 [Laodelphax striatellus]|uniref:Tetraspanin n=1 Tax=Laodelphax striatellus TaxID=195883 RepID=A0A482WX20_LAOST|nr:hypothetical protein LSTR_LSTR003165 [Laodelphax striatellus]